MIPTLQLGQLGRRIKGAGGSGSTYLDQLSTSPRAVFGLEKLVSTATNCLRVRRSSDNAEQDVGFVAGVIDTVSMLAFVGANNGFVVKWYDQMGNGEDLENATASTQPQIVSSGVYSGNISFNGTSQFLKITSLTLGNPQLGIYGKYSLTATAATRVLMELTTVASSNSGTMLLYQNGAQWFADSYNSSSNNRARRYAIEAASAVYTYLFDRSVSGSGEILAYMNGSARTVQAEAATTEQTGNYASNDFYLSARAGTSLFTTSAFESLVIYNADSASIRTSIEAILA